MIYVTVRQSPRYHQMTIDEFLFGPDRQSYLISQAQACTRTYTIEHPSAKMLENTDIAGLIRRFRAFRTACAELYAVPRASLYNTFYLSKRDKGWNAVFKAMWDSQKKYIRCEAGQAAKVVRDALHPLMERHPTERHDEIARESFVQIAQKLTELGFDMTEADPESWLKKGFRRIDAPEDTLKNSLTTLKSLLEKDCGALWHSTAFAYVKERSAADAVRRHQANESKWFAGFDLTDFFGSTTIEFVMQMLSVIWPFSQIMTDPEGRKVLQDVISLGFLDGHLPQGTPLSPTLTNIMMIPIDHALANGFRQLEISRTENGEVKTGKQRFIYTRYADDFLISSRYAFDVRQAEDFIKSMLLFWHAPFTVKEEKTRYGSSAGRNFHLGVMLNAENRITVGHENKHTFRAMLTNYILDARNGNPWDKTRVQQLAGIYSYYRSIEKEGADNIVCHVQSKFHVNVPEMLKRDLSLAT